MAGPSSLRLDPALQKYYDLNKNRWRYFRWSPRTAWIGFVYAALIPTGLGYVFWRTDGKWDMRAKLRGDTIAEW
ncbi:hypothetical protein GJ744_003304 [Endocarpon pusillum]|uniref:NADH-ubiquinone oxidoreductase B15 subunit n=1 Tax=Endocarpon pusillum TaxID=364733 RepID=A0A8H7A9U8_9EURO|nr:hypothetical protein GJ744_003304 [Endocarpon pusillum]